MFLKKNADVIRRSTIDRLLSWSSSGSRARFILPLLCGCLYTLVQSPFNHEFHPIFSLFPLGSFMVLIPFFAWSVQATKRRWMVDVYLFGIAASLTQLYWLSNVVVKGLWPIIMVGLGLVTLYMALYFLLYGALFRIIYRFSGVWFPTAFAAVWIIVEYGRTLTDLSFPWGFFGYNLVSILPVAQLASITGVYGLSWLLVAGNALLFGLLVPTPNVKTQRPFLLQAAFLLGILVVVVIWGTARIHRFKGGETIRIALIQNNMDQANWDGNNSLDSSMAITESMVYEARLKRPDLVLFPESGIYCYLDFQPRERAQVFAWRDSLRVPMLLGTLAIEPAGKERQHYDYNVYNSIFFLDRSAAAFEMYHKIRLLPFSEALPFEGLFPILSRLNLGESDFCRGRDERVFSSESLPGCAPFLCYEIIYPDFVRRRIAKGAGLIVNLTNDGWFGKSNGPYQHAAMARMRAIENGVPLARCANSGISMAVDGVGRVVGATRLYTRTTLTVDLSTKQIGTLYRRFGDWIIAFAALYLIIVLLFRGLTRPRQKGATASESPAVR